MSEILACPRRHLRLTVVAMEIPYPPRHGGRVDIWRRLCALKRAGVPVQLICWAPVPPSPEDEATIRANTADFICLGYPRGLSGRVRRAMRLVSYPLGVTSRLVRDPELGNLIARARAFDPDVVMADHVHCAILAEPIAKGLGKPMIVRSHDMEHVHYRELMKVAPTLKGRIVNYLEQRHLEAYEKGALRRSLAFFDISRADLARWQSMGFENGFHLPPLIEGLEGVRPVDSRAFSYDVVFLGNLLTDNNVSGVLWFLESVMPLLLKERPDIKVAIAGSRPRASVVKACAETPGVTLIPDPPDAATIYRSGRVCIDPVAKGLGVSIKSLDMLAAGRPIVSFEKGTMGLPEGVRGFFRVAHDAPSFAAAVLHSLNAPYAPPSQELLRHELGDGMVRRFLEQLDRLLNGQRAGPDPVSRAAGSRAVQHICQ